jgi:competence protein ComEC
LHWSRERVDYARDIKVIVGGEEKIARVRGKVVSKPALLTPESGVFGAWQHGVESTAFLLDVNRLESESGWEAAEGLMRVSVNEPLLDLAEGDNVEVFGLLMPLRPPANPGAFDWRTYYRQQGVHVRLFCDHRENVVLLGRERRSLAAWLRDKSRGLLTDDLLAGAADEASLLEAMVLGHRSRFDRRLNEVFTRAGCVHFIAASGTNIVILMGAFWLAGRMAGLNRRQCAWVMIPAIIV